MNKGIIIIATAHSLYGKLAYNLALTIKATGTSIPVCLIHDQAAIGKLDDEKLSIFDNLVQTAWNWNKVRFNVDKLSPYDHNLQLDADMLWLWKDPAELFEQHKDEELLFTNEGFHDIETGKSQLTGGYEWLADLQKTIELYQLTGKLYQLRWEAVLFKKTEKVRKFLAKAEAIRKKPKLKTWLFEGQPVDEFAFYVAANLLGFEQAVSPFLPAFWCKPLNNPTVKELSQKYFAIGFGGTRAGDEYKKMYDLIMTHASNKLGLPYTFRLQSKIHYIQSRTK